MSPTAATVETPSAVIDRISLVLDAFEGPGRLTLAQIVRRTGLPEDVSGTVVFLASSYCRYMTGQLLVVDGGLMKTF